MPRSEPSIPADCGSSRGDPGASSGDRASSPADPRAPSGDSGSSFRLFTRHVLPLLLIAASLVAALLLRDRLPDPVPGLLDREDPAEGMSRAFVVWGMPALALGVYVLWPVLNFFEPRRDNLARFAGEDWFFRTLVVGFTVYVHLITLGSAMGWIDPHKPLVAGGGILLMLVGNFLGRVRPNRFTGIRNPWTQRSATVWIRTHRFAGRALAGAGVLTLAAVPTPWGFHVLAATGVLAAIAITVYSYREYRREAGRGAPAADIG